MSIQSRLKSVEQRASERAARERASTCVCQYVEIMEDEALSEETARVVASNVLCFERNHKRASHVGFNTVIVASSKTSNEDDDSPLVA